MASTGVKFATGVRARAAAAFAQETRREPEFDHDEMTRADRVRMLDQEHLASDHQAGPATLACKTHASDRSGYLCHPKCRIPGALLRSGRTYNDTIGNFESLQKGFLVLQTLQVPELGFIRLTKNELLKFIKLMDSNYSFRVSASGPHFRTKKGQKLDWLEAIFTELDL